ncbi:MAG: helix-turn-helix domain-containing protein [Mycobacteriales bacterium]
MFPNSQVRARSDPIDTHGSGFTGWSGTPRVMPRAHRHDDVELNFVAAGHLDYLLGGTPLRLSAGQFVAFWGAIPHQLVGRSADLRYAWITVPARYFLRWRIPAPSRRHLLSGGPIVSRRPAADLSDADAFARWCRELNQPDPETIEITLLEMEARVRRAALAEPGDRTGRAQPDGDSVSTSGGVPDGSSVTGAGAHPFGWAAHRDPAGHVAAMASEIATSYAEPITASSVASARHLHPRYAMAIFKDMTGTTIGGYLTQCRVADAQRRLITSDDAISEIATAAGFSSLSRFYDAFTRMCGTSPGGYRAEHRG